MKRRGIESQLGAALSDTPVVFLQGARQTGKTTLVQSLVENRAEARYFTLDDAAVLAAVAADPQGFVTEQDGMVVIDEAQKVPELFPAIKLAVDRDRRPGRFLLTGSAQVLLLPSISESLAGRIEILTLRPFSQGEIDEVPEGFVDAVFSEGKPQLREAPARTTSLRQRLLSGGYPNAVQRHDEGRRRVWFASYITAILERDVRALSNIAGLTEMPRLLALLAVRSGALLNKADISRDAQLAYATLDRYLALLEKTFLLQLVPAWSGNLGKRLIKAPKVALGDSGLAAHLQGLTAARLGRDPHLFGPLLETFVAMELAKQASWAVRPVALFHFRTSAGSEVDCVLEDDAGRVVGVEVKAAATFGTKDVSGLRALADDLGDRFHRGVLLYTGDAVVPLGPRLWALPLDALWRWSV